MSERPTPTNIWQTGRLGTILRKHGLYDDLQARELALDVAAEFMRVDANTPAPLERAPQIDAGLIELRLAASHLSGFEKTAVMCVLRLVQSAVDLVAAQVVAVDTTAPRNLALFRHAREAVEEIHVIAAGLSAEAERRNTERRTRK